MDLQLIFAIILTVLPIVELRGGMPVAIHYAIENNFPTFPIFLLIILLNILIIFFIFFFLDHLHDAFLRFKAYKRSFDFYLEKIRKKADKVEQRMGRLGFVALALFVAIPLPGTGAWTGTLVAWVLGLERKKSIIAIACGVLIAGIIIYLASLGILNFFL